MDAPPKTVFRGTKLAWQNFSFHSLLSNYKSNTREMSSVLSSSSSDHKMDPIIPISYINNANSHSAPVYTQAVKAGSTIYISGCLGLIPANKTMPETIEQQTEQALTNIQSVIESSGGSLSTVVKVTIFLSSMSSYAKVNEIYARYFPNNPPARSCVAVAELPLKALIEIECIAIECQPKNK